MDSKLKARYKSVKRTLVVPNHVPDSFVLSQEAPEQKADGPIVLGLLSNLMFEKGVADFVAIVEQARAVGINAQGILAGPAWNAEMEAFIVAAVEKNGSALRWMGSVSGQSKEDFFAAIELFVFPTKCDAYPLVLLEALVRGRPIIAPDRGCIGSFRPLKSATIVDAGDDFVAAAVSHLASWHDDPQRPYAAVRAHAEGASLNAANNAANKQLVEAILAY
jgi:glycosyltransferase involved in cell wall biosynthesis